MIHADACEISDLIQSTYKQEFNIPYLIMEDQKIIERDIVAEAIDPALLADFKAKGDEMDDIRSMFEPLLNDLCFRGKLESGEYLIKFDD